jgi:alpha-tubulin suppressor-like RCC1 family protein
VEWGADDPVPDGLSDVTAIAADNRNSIALKSDGTVVEWGAYSKPAA